MLRDVSLQDCELIKVSEESEAASLYQLKCYRGRGTTGSARWESGSNTISGTLLVRLGGKNMTFYQRITAKPLGKCEVAVVCLSYAILASRFSPGRFEVPVRRMFGAVTRRARPVTCSWGRDAPISEVVSASLSLRWIT